MKKIQSDTFVKTDSEEEKYQEIIARISDPLIAIDSEWRYTYINETAELEMGFSAKDLLGKNVGELLPHKNAKEFKQACIKAMALQQYVYIELHALQNEKWYATHIYPSPEGITVTFRDITYRKEKEEEYIKQANRNALILDKMLDNFALTDEELNIIDVNHSFCKTLGYSKEELLTMKLSDLDADSGIDEVLQNFKDAIEKGNVLLETKKKKKTGEIIDVEITVTEMKIGSRTYFASFGRDISAYKKAEEQILNEKKLFSTIINSLPGLFYLFDEEGRFMAWNRNSEAVSGYTLEEMSTMHPLDFYPPEERQLLKSKIKEVFDKGMSEVEAHIYTKNEEKIPFYFSGRITYIEGKKCLLGTGIDISQLSKAREALYKMEKEISNRKVLEQKKISRAIINTQEKERTYIGRELHDNVNQLLASLRLYLGIAAKQNETTKELIKYPMELLDQAIIEIRSLTHKYVAPLQNVDLEQLVSKLLKTLENTGNIDVTFEYGINPEINDDDLKVNIFRILQEQVSNIIKHAKASAVFVSLKNAAGFVNIIVKDNGKGFDINKKREGIGISNIINRINSFNGEMEIKSRPEKGCEIKIKIPY